MLYEVITSIGYIAHVDNPALTRNASHSDIHADKELDEPGQGVATSRLLVYADDDATTVVTTA